jgi:hypothetical protein
MPDTIKIKTTALTTLILLDKQRLFLIVDTNSDADRDPGIYPDAMIKDPCCVRIDKAANRSSDQKEVQWSKLVSVNFAFNLLMALSLRISSEPENSIKYGKDNRHRSRNNQ